MNKPDSQDARRTPAVEPEYWTKDAGAGFGRRSASKGLPGRTYAGREVHVGVAVRAALRTDMTSYVSFGRDVPDVALVVRTVPAGSHCNDAVRDPVIKANEDGFCHDAIVDAGYSLKNRLAIPLQEAGIPLALQPKHYQRFEGVGIRTARVLDGQLFSQHVPEDLLHLEVPGQNATDAEVDASIALFERRAMFRYTRHKKPGKDGTTRWQCPFCAGRLRSRSLPRTMRHHRNAPLVELPPGAKCCDGLITVGADQVPLMQETIVGTRAWHASYGRRNRVETYNSYLHGGFTEIDKGYVRIVESEAGQGRIDTLFAHTVAGVNRWRVQVFQHTQRHLRAARVNGAVKPNRKPRKDRLARFEDLAELDGTSSTHEGQRGKDPPD